MPLKASKIAARYQWNAVVLVLVGLFLAYFVWNERDRTLERERDRLLTQARVIDTNLTQELAGVHAAMQSMRPPADARALDDARNQQRSNTLKALTDAMPAVRTMQIIGPSGRVVSSSRAETLGFDATQRPYFQAVQRQPDSDTLVVSAPFTTSLNVYALQLVRAWPDAQKQLAAAVTATLDPEHFKVLLRSVLYADDMRATLVHGDGIAFLTLPDNPTIQGSNLNQPGTVFTQHIATGQVESFHVIHVPVTGDRRMVAYRTVMPAVLKMNKPLLVAVSRDIQAVLAPWRQLAVALGGAYAIVCVLVFGGVYVVQRKQFALQQLTQTHALAAQEQAEWLDLALAGGNLGLFDLDMASGVRRINARAQEMVGDGPDDPMDTFTGWAERIHPDDRPDARALREAHERGESLSMNADYRVRHKLGHWVWVHSRGRITQRREDGTPLRMVGTYLDITERVQAQKVLREERLRLSNIVVGTNAGTWEHDLTTGTDLINDQYAAMLGYSAAEMAQRIGDDFRNIVHPDDVASAGQVWEAHLAGATPLYQAEFRVMHKDGHWVWIMSHGKVWSRDKEGRALNVSGIHLDVSAIKTAQARLEELNSQLELRVEERTAELEATLEQLRESQQSLASSEARATMSTLVAGLSHEMGTPLGNSVIAANTVSSGTRDFRHLLGEGGIKRSDLHQFIDLVEQGADIIAGNLGRANALMKNFRQVAADQASEQRRTFDLAQAVREILQTLSPTLKRHPHRITVDIADGIAMDSLPGPLGQILINLINNAYLHAFDGMAQGDLVIRAQAQGDWVEMEVRDNGRGIPQENLKKMFEPFFSTKIGEGGTGLGMAIVQNLLTKTLGGSIDVQSTVGQGTAFMLRFPRVLPAAAPVRA